MGVIRQIFLVYFLFISLHLLSQNSYDTVYFANKQFVQHAVQAGESLRYIADLHKVTTSDIKKSNELSANIYYGQLLYIPIYLNNTTDGLIPLDVLPSKLSISDTATIKIALLMPYLASHDGSYDTDTLPKSKISESVLSFHIGVELAIDSLRKAGHKIVLYTFDTRRDSIEVSRIISSNYLSDMDFIIGPMFSDLFYLVCNRYGADTTKVIVSRLSI